MPVQRTCSPARGTMTGRPMSTPSTSPASAPHASSVDVTDPHRLSIRPVPDDMQDSSHTPGQIPGTDSRSTNVVDLHSRLTPNHQAHVVDELSVPELEVVFYAAGYDLSIEEMLSAPNVVAMTAVAAEVVDRLGLDLIREIAAMSVYAQIICDLVLIKQLWPDIRRRGAASCASRAFHRVMTVLPNARVIAGLVDQWHAGISTHPSWAVAA